MKKSIYYYFLIAVYLVPIAGHSQRAGEWLNQKTTQIKYLLKQIAALQVYLGYVKQGYRIVSGGLNTIHDIKNGEFKLHDLYYKSLELVNPRIRNSPKVKAVINHQLYILKVCEELKNLIGSDKNLSPSLNTYINDVVGLLLEGTEKVRKDLEDVITDNSLKMTDNERLDRLDALYNRSKDQFVFAQKFSSEVIVLIKSAQQEQQDDKILKSLHGLQ